MANLKEIRIRIKSVKSTQQITKAMKMVSAAKLRKAQDNIIMLRPYAAKLNELIHNLQDSTDTGTPDTAWTRTGEVNKVLLILVTSNKGLCGAFNSSVIRLASQLIADKYAAQHKAGNLKLLCIGKYGFEYFNRRKFPILGNHNTDLFSPVSFTRADAVISSVMKDFSLGEYDHVELIYNEFKNVATQNRIHQQLLPIQLQSEASQKLSASTHKEYIFEPGKTEILSELLPRSVKIQFYKAILESNASEHGARMTAMDKATENANDLLGKLKLYYNSARQAAITKELLEIVGGANALSAGN